VFAQRSESIFNVKCLFASRTNETSSNKNTKNLKSHKETECVFLIQNSTLFGNIKYFKWWEDSLIP